MDWNKLKEGQDLKSEKEEKIKVLKDQWLLLDEKCKESYKRFDQLTYVTKKEMERVAIEDFKNYFQEKDFNVSGNTNAFSAVYRDVNIIFSINGDFAYGIHFYVGQVLKDCKVFSIDMEKEFYSKYKQLFV